MMDPTELAYIFREINKLGTGQKLNIPDFEHPPKPVYERIVPGGPLPPPEPTPQPVSQPKPPDPRLIEIAKIWHSLEETDRQRLYYLAKVIDHLKAK